MDLQQILEHTGRFYATSTAVVCGTTRFSYRGFGERDVQLPPLFRALLRHSGDGDAGGSAQCPSIGQRDRLDPQRFRKQHPLGGPRIPAPAGGDP